MKHISYDGEFGYELVGVLPYAYWLHINCFQVSTGAVGVRCLPTLRRSTACMGWLGCVRTATCKLGSAGGNLPS